MLHLAEQVAEVLAVHAALAVPRVRLRRRPHQCRLAQILIHILGLHGGVYGAIAGFDFIGKSGYIIVGAFVVTWAAAFLVYKVRRIDERWSEAVDKVA